MNPQDPYQPQQPYQPQPTPQTPPAPAQPSQDGQYNVVPPIVANSATNGHNPYEFIFNEQSHHTSSGSMAKRIFLVVIGVAILAVLFAVVSSLLSAGSSSWKEQLKTITQQQEEIILVALDGKKNLTDPSLKNTAATLELSTSSSQAQLLSFASQNGYTIDSKELKLLHDDATDKLLADAKTTSTYDTTWKQTVTAQLDENATALKKLYGQAKSSELKKLLKTAYQNTVLISTQLKQ